jgi:hypothetical protein
MEDDLKTCPDCAENVKFAAKVCRFCGHDFYILEQKKAKLKKKIDFQNQLRKKYDEGFQEEYKIKSESGEFGFNGGGVKLIKSVDEQFGKSFYYISYHKVTSLVHAEVDDFYNDTDSNQFILSKEQNVWKDQVNKEISLDGAVEALLKIGYKIDPASFSGNERIYETILEGYPSIKKLMDNRDSKEFMLRWDVGLKKYIEDQKLQKIANNKEAKPINFGTWIFWLFIIGISFSVVHCIANPKSSTLGDRCSQYSDPNDQLRCLANGAARANDAERRRLNGL